MFVPLQDDKEDSYIQTEAIERLHSLIPQKVNVDFENTNITLSMHSQKRWAVMLQLLCSILNVIFVL